MKGLLNSNIKARYTRLYTFVYELLEASRKKKYKICSCWEPMTPFDCGYILVFFLHFILSEIIPITNVVSALFTEYGFNKLWCLHALMQNSVTCIKVMNMLSIFSLSHVFDQLPENGYVSLVQHSLNSKETLQWRSSAWKLLFLGRGEADVPTHLQHDLSCAEGMQPESNHNQSLTLGIFFLRISLLKGLNQPCETSGPAYSDFMERFYYAWVLEAITIGVM